MNEPRVWKWLVPGVAMVLMIPLAGWTNMVAVRNGWGWWCSAFWVGVMPILGIQAWAGFRAYYGRLETENFVDRQNALAMSRDVKMFEYARTMHPETVRQLLLLKKIVWRVKAGKPGEVADWILDEDPRVRVRFVEYVLRNSGVDRLMPMNGFLSDKSYSFDEGKVVSDYDQYRAFHAVLINLGMATDAFGNQSGQIIPPWTPELIAARWGIVLEDEEETPSVGVPTSPPNSESTNLGAAKDPHPQPLSQRERVDKGEPELSDADFMRVNALETARMTLSPKDYLKFCQSQK
jgi:hypothetical protein